MFQNIVVINRIGTYRRLTVMALQELGLDSIHEVNGENEAEGIISDLNNGVLVVLEFTLPRYQESSFRFLEWLRQFRKDKGIFVLATSFEADEDFIVRLTRAGVDELVLKSFDPDLYSKQLGLSILRVVPESAIGSLAERS